MTVINFSQISMISLTRVILCLAFQVLPIIIFFSSVISLCYYIGIMQLIIKKIAWLMQITMKTSGVESLNAAGNIFIGQVHFFLTFIFYFILKYSTYMYKKVSLLKFSHNGLHLLKILISLPGLANKSDILNNTQCNCNKLAIQN